MSSGTDAINRLNTSELQKGDKGSWHDEYKDSAIIYVAGLSNKLSEGDLTAIFSQYGELVDVKLIRDRDTGDSKGYGFLTYQDARSAVLAVDNMNGIKILERTIKVDHSKNKA